MSGEAPAALECLIPGDPATRTGGYRYDARLIAGLRESGLRVCIRRLSDRFPFPDAAALAEADAVLNALPTGARVLIDGLAYGALAEVVCRHAERLRLIALVHHPLALETGLSPERAAALEAGERRALTCAARVLVTSESTARSVSALGVPPERITVAEPGCDPAPLAHGSARAKPGQAPEPYRLLCVATLTPRKGHAVLIEALARLPSPGRHANGRASLDARPDWRLLCVGSRTRDPETAADIARRVAGHGLSDRVRLCGEVDDAELAALYAGADAFVCASWWEGYGMALAEALARGLPLITTTGGALAHTAPGHASLRVAPGDVDGLSAAIGRFLDDAALRDRLTRGAREARLALPRWADTVGTVRALLDALGR